MKDEIFTLRFGEKELELKRKMKALAALYSQTLNDFIISIIAERINQEESGQNYAIKDVHAANAELESTKKDLDNLLIEVSDLRQKVDNFLGEKGKK